MRTKSKRLASKHHKQNEDRTPTKNNPASHLQENQEKPKGQAESQQNKAKEKTENQEKQTRTCQNLGIKITEREGHLPKNHHLPLRKKRNPPKP